MKIDKFSQKTIPELLKLLGWSPLACFIFVSLVATLVAFHVIGNTGATIDINDPGVLAILAIMAFFTYGSIWIFIRSITNENKKR